MKLIASAFVRAQRGFAPALKTSTNPHFKSKYADLAACVEAVLDALNENGIGLIQKTHESSDGVTVETVFMHESGETIDGGRLHVPAAKQDPQGYGSALSYARRYSLMAACGIAPEDDDGNAASKKLPPGVVRDAHVSATEEAFKRLQPEDQSRVEKIAYRIKAATNASLMLDVLNAEDLDQDQKAGLWYLLDSKTRSAIKAAQKEAA